MREAPGHFIVARSLENAQHLAVLRERIPTLVHFTEDDAIKTARATGLKAFYIDPFDPCEDNEIEIPSTRLRNILIDSGLALALCVLISYAVYLTFRG